MKSDTKIILFTTLDKRLFKALVRQQLIVKIVYSLLQIK